MQIGFMPRGAVDPARAVPARVDARASTTTISTGWAYPPKDYAKWARARLPVGRSTASSGTAGPRWRQWYWEVWNEPNIALLAGHAARSSTSSTTTPSTPCGAPCRRRGSAARTSPAGRAASSCEDFLEHCLRGTNYATGETGTPLDFVSFHAKGAPTFVDGHVRMGIANQLSDIDTRLRDRSRRIPELKGKPIVIGESDPDGCAACQGPQNGYRNGTMYSSYTAAELRPQARPGRQARRELRRRADLGVRVRGPAVLRRLPRAGDQRHRSAGAERLPHVRPRWAGSGWRWKAPARSRWRRSCKDGVRGKPDVAGAGEPATATSSASWSGTTTTTTCPGRTPRWNFAGTAGCRGPARREADALPHRRHAQQRLHRLDRNGFAARARRRAVRRAGATPDGSRQLGAPATLAVTQGAATLINSICRARACRCWWSRTTTGENMRMTQ